MSEPVTPGTVMYFALRIASARLDRTVSSAEFVELIDSLIGAAAEHVRDSAAPRPPLLGSAAGQAAKILTDPDDEPGAGGTTDEDDDDPPDSSSTDGEASGDVAARANGRGVSYDDRVRIRLEHDAHMEGRRAAGFSIAERGFNDGLVLRYGLKSKQQLHDILRHAGE